MTCGRVRQCSHRPLLSGGPLHPRMKLKYTDEAKPLNQMVSEARYHTSHLRMVPKQHRNIITTVIKMPPKFSTAVLTALFAQADVKGGGGVIRADLESIARSSSSFFWMFCAPMVSGAHMSTAWKFAKVWSEHSKNDEDFNHANEDFDVTPDFPDDGSWPNEADRTHMIEMCIELVEEIVIARRQERARNPAGGLERSVVIDVSSWMSYFTHFGFHEVSAGDAKQR
eukprot:NODE_11482_length_1284_cov_4.397580.p1 GENE.NODE_11482_length_1284_cov_4.397580~~NODE_11482_length_1284_cov_4.397580.p1  ORF type:complete len:226 (-),score=53.75 NODE_11482_length_1284_cov_4.397580:28-705(-)